MDQWIDPCHQLLVTQSRQLAWLWSMSFCGCPALRDAQWNQRILWEGEGHSYPSYAYWTTMGTQGHTDEFVGLQTLLEDHHCCGGAQGESQLECYEIMWQWQRQEFKTQDTARVNQHNHGHNPHLDEPGIVPQPAWAHCAISAMFTSVMPMFEDIAHAKTCRMGTGKIDLAVWWTA